VTATKLFYDVPVRREYAAKHAAYTKAKIKAMMRAYALSRPQVRFELLIKPATGGGSASRDFIYVPHPSEPCVVDAATKLFDPDVMAGLTVQQALNDYYSISALIPKRNALEGKKAVIRGGAGQFLFIDSRPVTCKSGIGRLIVKALREKLEACKGWDTDAKNAVLVMDVRCGLRSYDVNVEPSKETILFTNEREIAMLLEEWFGKIYVPQEEKGKSKCQDGGGKGEIAGENADKGEQGDVNMSTGI
jgi:DNA mismatch repair ATPase MutL